MSSDKISSLLEKYLKILGQKVRIDILKVLNNNTTPLSYSSIKKKVLEKENRSTNLSFHLNALKDQDLIRSTDRGYSLTSLGTQILEKILSIEQIILNDQKTIMVRTSKYSIEPLNINKIEKYLIKEGKIEPFLAESLTQEIRKRISKLDIDYLTAPLLREYINSVLVDMGYQQYRNNLTRLGSPPFDVSQLFCNENCPPERFLRELGSETSEQYLLLNLLPHHLSDLFLSGEIALLNLETWHLKPLSLLAKTSQIVNSLSQNKNNFFQNNDLQCYMFSFFKKLNKIIPYFSQDIILGDLCEFLFHSFNKTEENIYKFLELLEFQSKNYKHLMPQNTRLILDITSECIEQSKIKESHSLKFIELYCKILNINHNKNNTKNNPLILADRHLFSKNCLLKTNQKNPNFLQNQDIIFTDKNNLLNSSLVKIPFDEEFNSIVIILDKILINLFLIALKAKHNDDLFFNLLEDKMGHVFEFFTYKKEFLKKKLGNISQWNRILQTLLMKSKNDLYDNALKSISFFGLNSAIKFHCGIELDKVKQSEQFALKVIKFLANIIHEKNQVEHEKYCLTQPHLGEYLDASWNKTKISLDNHKYYSNRFIRKESNLSIEKRISLFKKFENLVNGGSLFKIPVKDKSIELNTLSELLLKAKINTFAFEGI
ncbi:MAG: hypothetical protein BAJALOKI2v1_200034 [Promethearchaeota archaeon]|nr:MAG: hypothetical protein BAJALOKI2v1_200034 [Candidatus Lokiarchaeota archaeon]